MFTLFKSKPFFTPAQQHKIMQAIKDAERRTSGEIRLFVESRCRFVESMDRAVEVFHALKMDQTAERNGVLIYMAYKDHQLSVFGDEGIYKKTGKPFWEERIAHILTHFNKEDYVAGMITAITEIGEALYLHFPYNETTDKNELSDDIVFGK